MRPIQPNNFDLLRLIAAAQVVLTHLGRHLLPPGNDWLVVTSFFPGVPVFFFISGFLVSASWERAKSTGSYVRNRFLRIYPGLWATFALSLAVGILLAPGLFTAGAKLPLWMLAQITIFQDWNPAFLRGYGSGVWNAALWTIPIELAFYASIPVLYWLARKLRSMTPVLVTTTIVSFALQYWDWMFFAEASERNLSWKLLTYSPLPWIGMFCIGILAQRHFERLLPIVRGRALVFLGVFALICLATYYYPVEPLLFSTSRFLGIANVIALDFLVLSAAFTLPGLAERLLRRNDISYGIYLMHMPVTNAALQLGYIGGMAALGVTAITCGLAVGQWIFIEKPALARRLSPLYKHEV